MKQKSKKQSSKPNSSSNYAVEISPAHLIDRKSAALVRIGSVFRDEEFIPVILVPVGRAISNERQVTKKKKGFDAAELKVTWQMLVG